MTQQDLERKGRQFAHDTEHLGIESDEFAALIGYVVIIASILPETYAQPLRRLARWSLLSAFDEEARAKVGVRRSEGRWRPSLPGEEFPILKAS